MLIIIDPGHGGKDSGAVGPTGLKEKDVTLNIALRLGEVLQAKGIEIVYTRSTDVFVELSDRAAKANKLKADYFVSIHTNSATSSSAGGTETYIYVEDGKTDKLAQSVQTELNKLNNLLDRGVKKADFAVLRETAMPAILVEVAFISNKNEENLLRDSNFLQQTAEGVANGIFNFLGIKETQHWGQPAIDELKKLGLIADNKDPKAYVTWAEFATVLVRTINMLKK